MPAPGPLHRMVAIPPRTPGEPYTPIPPYSMWDKFRVDWEIGMPVEKAGLVVKAPFMVALSVVTTVPVLPLFAADMVREKIRTRNRGNEQRSL